MRLIRQDVPEFQVIPWWMGIAYRRYDRQETVCYVVPLNWVVCLGLWVWWRLKRIGLMDSIYWFHSLQRAAYQVGYERGYQRGWERGYQAAETGLQTGLRRQVIEEFEDRRRAYPSVPVEVPGDEVARSLRGKSGEVPGAVVDRRGESLRGKSGGEEVGPGLASTGIEGPQGGVQF